MAIPYRTAKFISANIFAMVILDPTAKFNSRQYFWLYGNSQWTLLLCMCIILYTCTLYVTYPVWLQGGGWGGRVTKIVYLVTTVTRMTMIHVESFIQACGRRVHIHVGTRSCTCTCTSMHACNHCIEVCRFDDHHQL